MIKIIPLINYELKSIPGRSVNLPQEAMVQADGLMKVIVESKDTTDLFEKVKGNPLLNEIYSSGIEEGVLRKAGYLRKSKVDTVRSLSFKDDIYLQAGLDYLTRNGRESYMTLPFREAIDRARTEVIRNMCDMSGARRRLNLGGKK